MSPASAAARGLERAWPAAGGCEQRVHVVFRCESCLRISVVLNGQSISQPLAKFSLRDREAVGRVPRYGHYRIARRCRLTNSSSSI